MARGTVDTQKQSTPQRPNGVPLVVGALFLWAGLAGVLGSITTLDAGTSIAVGLGASGVVVLGAIILPVLSKTAAPEFSDMDEDSLPAESTELESWAGW